MAKPSFQAPKGTRDLYPEDMLRRRYLTQTWRDTAIRHGFEQIDGPTFEMSKLYAVKSGEGILGELFQAFNGKNPEQVAEVQKEGRAPLALRPEFTPTGSRLFASAAGQLRRPTRWFNIGSRFRAERPQRGRLNEFLQFDCDVIGDDESPAGRAAADAACIFTAVDTLRELGLTRHDVTIERNDRARVEYMFRQCGIPRAKFEAWFLLADKSAKINREEFILQAIELGFEQDGADWMHTFFTAITYPEMPASLKALTETEAKELHDEFRIKVGNASHRLDQLFKNVDLWQWQRVNPSIVRGLAYYTGTVFEVIAEGERAVAGGGRYDNLVELLGGPATPAVGFAMGDVVLSLLLEDKGLMPEGRELMEAVSRPPASVRPDVFVFSGAAKDEDESIAAELDRAVTRLCADARRGVASAAYEQGEARPWSAERYDVAPLHARTTDKATRNLKKLLTDAEKQHARFAAIVHEPDKVQLKDLDRREDVPEDFSVDPGSEKYVGRAVAERLGRG
ncbi:MAG: ATP phosphoribosyltransferase regulatory subunit [Planctomycetota bacterium]